VSLCSDTQSGFDPTVDSSVGVNTLQAELLESQGLVFRRGRDFSLLHSMQNDHEDYLPSYYWVLATLVLRESSLT